MLESRPILWTSQVSQMALNATVAFKTINVLHSAQFCRPVEKTEKCSTSSLCLKRVTGQYNLQN